MYTVGVEKLRNYLVVKGFSFGVPFRDNKKSYKDEDAHRKKDVEDNSSYIYAGLEGCSSTFCYSTLHSLLERAW